MAQTDDFIEQVNEELEKDEFRKYWQENRGRILLMVGLFFGSLFAYVGWQDYRHGQDESDSRQFAIGQARLAAKDAPGAAAALDKLLKEGAGPGYTPLGGLLRAQALVKAGKADEAHGQLVQSIAAVSDPVLKDLLRMQDANLRVDQATDRAAVKALLADIGAESPFRPHALELEGVWLLQHGEEAEALKLFKEALLANPSGSLRDRLSRQVRRMGG
ncbi:MAG: tetratricopeptide repeat protein [Magnetococcales bacterium]|nr:tetratricopeptide repeat protein [Magnetococcales bacterium]